MKEIKEKLEGLIRNKNHLLMLVLAGALLMVIALPVEKKTTQKEQADSDTTLNAATLNNDSYDSEEAGMLSETEAYMMALEQKVGELLSGMEGAGQVRVVLTWRTSAERIVEKDTSTARSNSIEEDSQGGTRTVNDLDAGENTVMSTRGSGAEPYVIKTVSPKVEGGLILAQGAGNGTVSKNLSDAAQVLFGIEAHQVKVIRMESAKTQ